MKFIKVKTRPILPPQDDIYPILDKYLPKIKEGDVVVITSKILAIHQGRCVKIDNTVKKDDLIISEAERCIPRHLVPNGNFILAIKENTLIASSGIDESNSKGYYTLWPKNSVRLAKELRKYLLEKYNLKKLAVIITDSHTTPLRFGVNGISIGFFGLEPMIDYRGKKDIFGRVLKFTQTNVVDALSGMAVLLMGEGNEQTPIVIIREAEFIKFTDRNTYKKLAIPYSQDIYSPLFKVFKGNKNRQNQE